MSEEKKTKIKRISKIIVRQKSLNIINKIVFCYDLIKYATQLYIIKSLYLCHLYRLMEIKAQWYMINIYY